MHPEAFGQAIISPKKGGIATTRCTDSMLFVDRQRFENNFPPKGTQSFVTRKTIWVVGFPDNVDPRGVHSVEELVQIFR